jgi:hypothetical protein
MLPFSSMTFCDAAAVSGRASSQWTIHVLAAAAAYSLCQSESGLNISLC